MKNLKNVKNVTLEMSLKPFKRIEQAYVEKVCRKMFDQWRGILKYADQISVMLWTADGSEILEYRGELDEEIEWAKYIGGANPREEWDKKKDPEGIGLHTRNYLYIENPPVITYRVLKRIIDTIKTIGTEITGKPVRVGETFDPGPEFAKSDFKYRKHEEICMGEAMGKKSFVCCYALLHQDSCSYAGFPGGIPEGTPFGTFFGRQCKYFLKDVGFDYLWFSNGLGFGCETWGTTGTIFDGERFTKEKLKGVQQKILEFWKLFRSECPDIRIETRGTNLTAGIDLASDGVDLKGIYEGGFNVLPPPNSPWAAMDGDFGLELTGYMSRMAKLPGTEEYIFRFYIHDPWWMNSPWLDRYEGQPHDIYLPLAVSRVDEKGVIQTPGYLNLLTADNSLGEMPEQCPNEIIPHLLKAYAHLPDEISPLLWVYPFDEYFDNAAEKEGILEKAFFEDWYIRGAINQGLPLSTVISTEAFIKTFDENPGMYRGVIIVTSVPLKDSRMEMQLLKIVSNGGKVLLYGSLTGAGDSLKKALNIKASAPLEGVFHLHLNMGQENPNREFYSEKIKHESLLSGGGIDTVPAELEDTDIDTEAMAWAERGKEKRIVAVHRNPVSWKSGSMVWLRGTSANDFYKGEFLLTPHDPEQYFPAEALLRLSLRKFGYHLDFVKENPQSKSPVIMLHRNNKAFYFSGYMPDTTVKIRMKFPLGAPLLLGSETKLEQGYSVWSMPRAWHSECRVFVEQEDGNSILSVREYYSGSYYMQRRLFLTGLKDAVVRILPERGFEETTEVLLNSDKYSNIVGEPINTKLIDTPWGKVIETEKVTGWLTISTPKEIGK